MNPCQINSAAPRARFMVGDSAAVLKRLYFLQRELVLMQAGWVPGIEQWEHKLLLPEFLWEDALIAQQLRQRVLELRYPDRRIVPGDDSALLAQWRSFRNAPDAVAFATASLPSLKAALRRTCLAYIQITDALNDGPTLRILRQAVEDIDRQLQRLAAVPLARASAAGERWREATANAGTGWDPFASLNDWVASLRLDWQAAGGREFVLVRRASRDPRFQRLRFAWPDRAERGRGPGDGIELQMRVAIHHINEVWAAEMAAAVLFDLADEAPPEFLEEAARWCYDEIRHCQMGYERLREWGFRPEEIALDTFSYDASADADAMVRLGTIYYFETTYIHTKSERTKIFSRTGDRLSAHDMDFDWADELIHTYYGSKWLKHFLEARRDGRSPDEIKLRAQQLVQAEQDAATAEDLLATARFRHELLQRASVLASEAAARKAGEFFSPACAMPEIED